MPRPSYEQHRATRAARNAAGDARSGIPRRGSVAESETDLESLASYSTHQSSSSHSHPYHLSANSQYSQSNFAPRLPSPSSFSSSSLQASSYLPLRQRTYSSTSHASSTYSPTLPSQHHRHLDLLRASSSANGPGTTSQPHSDSSNTISRAERREKRRKRRQEKSTLSGGKYDSPVRRWLRWMSVVGLGRWSVGLGLIGAGIVKSAVGMGGFSGKDAPPMYGDFEAQRHWMEVTIHRPISEWYTYGPEWWQLDYPPVTGYISYLCGRIGASLDPSHFELDASRGLSPEALVTFMRMSVLTLEGLFWWTAVVAWVISEGKKGGRSWRSQVTGILTILFQPSLTQIDNGHFQYNSILLGLSLFSLLFLSRSQDSLACISFSLALGFKQMGLYYAPAIGCYLLGKCIWLGGLSGLLHFIKLGMVTSFTFLAIFGPWLRPFPGAIQQVIHRMFPFARGIFEDKVANFWCASNVVIKWKRYFGVTGMARLATVATLLGLLPTVFVILYCSYTLRLMPTTKSSTSDQDAKQCTTIEMSVTDISSQSISVELPPQRFEDLPHPPATLNLLPIALFTSSLTFFLFSFQVHEKSILLPLMPLTILMAYRGSSARGTEAGIGHSEGDEVWEFGVLINNIAIFSMWPLIRRDGQGIGYVIVTFLWNWMIGYSPLNVEVSWIRHLGHVIYPVIAVLHILEALTPSIIPLPKSYPDLYVVLNVIVSFAVFGIAWLWGMKKLVEGAWGIGGFGGFGLGSVSYKRDKGKGMKAL